MYALNDMYVRKTLFLKKPAASTYLRKPLFINTGNAGITQVINDC